MFSFAPQHALANISKDTCIRSPKPSIHILPHASCAVLRGATSWFMTTWRVRGGLESRLIARRTRGSTWIAY